MRCGTATTTPLKQGVSWCCLSRLVCLHHSHVPSFLFSRLGAPCLGDPRTATTPHEACRRKAFGAPDTLRWRERDPYEDPLCERGPRACARGSAIRAIH